MIPVPGDGPPVAAARIDASAMPTGKPRQVWLQDNGRLVGLLVEQTGCQQMSGQAIEQSANRVVIEVITTVDGFSGKMCPMSVRQVPIGVRLSAPLGNRMIVLEEVIRR